MQLPYSDELNIGYLSRLFDNTSECYKLFWFKAIVLKVFEGKTVLSYDELIDKMIADAWYMVTEYHLNLGPNDTLEKLILYIKNENPSIRSSEKETVILDYLAGTKDKEVARKKKTLTYNVPYYLQSPFLPQMRSKDWGRTPAEKANRINQEERVIYYYSAINGLLTEIRVQDDWAKYIRKNYEILLGWIEYNMIRYLQRRNPNVPGIADKLAPPVERKLEKVKKYWKRVLLHGPVDEIYDGQTLTISSKNISMDHFVPWSYVAHDELWNLSPTTKKINSQKSNNLPDWDTYFSKLVDIEFYSYDLIWKYEDVRMEFEACAKEHINNEEVRYRIYREGLSKKQFAAGLKSVVLPAYEAARDCGFANWKYTGGNT